MKHLNKETIKTCSLPILQRLMINFLLLQKAHEAKIEYLKCVKVPDLSDKFIGHDRREAIKRKQVLFRRKQLAITTNSEKLVNLPIYTEKDRQSHHFSHLKIKKPADLPCSKVNIPSKSSYNFTATPM